MIKKESLIQHILNASRYSVDGLRFAFQKEMAFRWEVLLFLVLIPIGLWVSDTAIERLLVVLIPIFILVIELLNTAIEAIVNLVLGQKRHPLARAAKDMGSAAVLLGFMSLGCVWVWIFL